MSERLEARETRWRLVGKLRLCPGGWRRGRARLKACTETEPTEASGCVW